MHVSVERPIKTPTNKSGTITTGGAAQNVCAANTKRKGFWFQNVSDTDMWLYELGTAVADQPAVKVAAGQAFEFPVTTIGAISVICATTGKKFSAREW